MMRPYALRAGSSDQFNLNNTQKNMLQTIHDKAKGWIAYAIVGFISVPFALWGINSYMEGGSTKAAAVVNGEDVPAQEVQQELGQIRQQFGQMAAQLGDDSLKKMALNNVVNQVLLRQKAKDEGYRASTENVATAISQISVFQKDGQFDKATYESFLASQRRNQGAFEEQMRTDITNGQFRDGLQSTAFATKAQMEQYQTLRNQKRDIELFTIKVADFEPQIQITDEQISKYYAEHKSQFMTEEKVKVAYIDLNQEALAKTVTVDAGGLQAYYDEHKDRYLTPETRNTSHILVAVDDPAQDAEAKKKIDAIYADIQAGKKTFEDVAKTESDDKATAEAAGVVGDVAAGSWDPEFEKAVFAAEVNKMIEPVKTGAGYEIIRVNSVKAAVQKTYEEVKAQVEQDYRRAEAEKLFLDAAEKLQTIAYEQSGDLAPASKAVNVAVQESGWLTRSKGEGVLIDPKVLAEAFSDEVLKEGKNSQVVQVSDTQAIVLRSAGQEPAAQKPLEEVKAEITTLLKAQEARKLVAQKGDELLKQLKTTGWAALDASGLGKAEAIEKPGFVQRTGSTVAPEVIEKTFTLPRPAAGQLDWDKVVLASGDYTIISLKSVEDGANTIEENSAQMYGGVSGSRELDAALEDLRARSEIELHPENI
ncbi:SurA N-terminal domain-containing protein [uncultured Thiothrix sp.]|uniref:SurA N-terminal domain-containing protein n=1 Tax=uncultured Thiothrix sp. TaxID=223185 RepID=UPI002630BE08|nr:SurA N-terminal domain-containing protein [uncultured Thiothrix sp.]